MNAPHDTKELQSLWRLCFLQISMPKQMANLYIGSIFYISNKDISKISFFIDNSACWLEESNNQNDSDHLANHLLLYLWIIII